MIMTFLLAILVVIATIWTAIHISALVAFPVCIIGITALAALTLKRSHRRLKNRPGHWDHDLGPDPDKFVIPWNVLDNDDK